MAYVSADMEVLETFKDGSPKFCRGADGKCVLYLKLPGNNVVEKSCPDWAYREWELRSNDRFEDDDGGIWTKGDQVKASKGSRKDETGYVTGNIGKLYVKDFGEDQRLALAARQEAKKDYKPKKTKAPSKKVSWSRAFKVEIQWDSDRGVQGYKPQNLEKTGARNDNWKLLPKLSPAMMAMVGMITAINPKLPPPALVAMLGNIMKNVNGTTVEREDIISVIKTADLSNITAAMEANPGTEVAELCGAILAIAAGDAK